MYVAVFPEMVQRLGNSVSVAYCVAWLDFRTRSENRDTYMREGRRWWRVTTTEMSIEMGVTEKMARKMIEHAVAHGAVACAEHQRTGWRDRAKSYTVMDGFRVGPQLPDGAAEHRPRRADVPSYKEENNIQAQAPGIDEAKPQRRTKPPHKLPDEWTPNQSHKDKAKALGVDVDAASEKMRRWAYAGDHKRKNWNQTFNTFLANTKPSQTPSIGGVSQFDRLLDAYDINGVEALVGDRYREPVEFVELSPGERETSRRADFRRWALERRQNVQG